MGECRVAARVVAVIIGRAGWGWVVVGALVDWVIIGARLGAVGPLAVTAVGAWCGAVVVGERGAGCDRPRLVVSCSVLVDRCPCSCVVVVLLRVGGVGLLRTHVGTGGVVWCGCGRSGGYECVWIGGTGTGAAVVLAGRGGWE